MAIKVWNPVTTGKLSVKPAQNQPKLVVTNKPSTAKVTVTPTPQAPPLKVGANFGMQGQGGYNPQRTSGVGVLQGSQAPVQRTATNVVQNTYNPQTGNVDRTIEVKMLTDSEKEKALIASRVSQQVADDIAELRKQLGGSANYKNELYKYNQSVQAELASSFATVYSDFQKANGEINQLRNNAKTEQERKFYDEQLKANDQQWKEWQTTQSAISNQTNSQIRKESEISRISLTGRAGQVIGATSGFLHSKGVGRFNLGNLWKYTLGSGTDAIPSITSIPTRAVKFGQNVIDPNREMEYEDQRRSGLPKGDKTSIGDRWMATNKQKIFNEAIFDDVGKGPVENFSNNLAMWGKQWFGVDKTPEFYSGFASFMTDEFADVSNYIGAGSAKKIGGIISKSDTLADATKATSRVLKPLQESFNASKTGKVLSYPFKKQVTPSKVRADASADFYAKQSKEWDDVKRLYKEGKADVAQTKKVAQQTQDNIWNEFNDRWTSTYDAQGNINKALTWSKTKATRNQVAGDIQEYIEKGTYQAGRYSDKQNEIIMRTAENLRTFTKDLEKFDAEHGITYVRGRRANYLPQRGSQWKTKPKKDFKETDYTQSRTKTRKVGSYKGQKKGNVSREMAGYRKAGTGGYEKFTKAKEKAEKLKAESKTFKTTNYKKNPDKIFGKPVSQKTSKVAKAINPINIWKKGVLNYNPAWRVNNEISNVAQTVTEAGPRALTKQFRGRKALSERFKLDMKEQLKIAGSSMYGAKGLKGQEARARIGLYIAQREKGLTHKDALKSLDTVLGNYGELRNIERPIQAVLPFYKWQKHVTKTVATMPFRNPRGASIWAGAYQGLYEKPLNQLPDVDQETVDPETGEKTVYNPREAFRGKLYNPVTKQWMNTPFNMMTPSTLEGLGINPLITAFNEWNTGNDKYGKNLSAEQWWESLTRRFPQYNLAKAFIDNNRQEGGMLADKFGEIKNKDQWLALGSGMPKEVQGSDENASNYAKRLDAGENWKNKARSFVGIPNEVGFDEKQFNDRKKRNDFTKEWFATDWDTKYPEWEDKNKAQEEMATKYGYDLQKDVYGTSSSVGIFNKNDSAFTKGVKKQKEEARSFTTGFWDQYNQQPKGTRTKWAKSKMAEWEKTDAFRNNPEVVGLPKDWMRQYQTAEDIAYGKKRLAEARAKGLAKYRASPKGQFWEKYLSMEQGSKERATFYNEYYKPEYGGKKSDPAKKKEREIKTEFWLNYFASNPQEQKKLALANPQYFKQLAPRTSDQINADRIAKRDEMTGILNKTGNWTQLVNQQRSGINKDVSRFAKVKQSKKVIWKI